MIKCKTAQEIDN